MKKLLKLMLINLLKSLEDDNYKLSEFELGVREGRVNAIVVEEEPDAKKARNEDKIRKLKQVVIELDEEGLL